MMSPAIGSRWRHASGNVYEYVGVNLAADPPYCHVMRLVSRHRLDVTPLGHAMTVELPWFEHAATEVR
jgi:hypothetical protein